MWWCDCGGPGRLLLSSLDDVVAIGGQWGSIAPENTVLYRLFFFLFFFPSSGCWTSSFHHARAPGRLRYFFGSPLPPWHQLRCAEPARLGDNVGSTLFYTRTLYILHAFRVVWARRALSARASQPIPARSDSRRSSVLSAR